MSSLSDGRSKSCKGLQIENQPRDAGSGITTNTIDTSNCKLLFYGTTTSILELSVYEPEVPRLELPESLVQSIWAQQAFTNDQLVTHAGDTLNIINPGKLNRDAGPDFLGATLDINGIVWHGDIEIHRTSKDWFTHQHHVNPRYNSTILHVSLFQDAHTGTLRRADKSLLSELILSTYLRTTLRKLLYAHRTTPTAGIACQNLQADCKDLQLAPWLQALGQKRLYRKKARVAASFLKTPNLEILLYRLILAGLGYGKNIEPMLDIAKRVPVFTARSISNAADRAGVFLAVSGLLFSNYSAYPEFDEKLKKRYIQLAKQLEIVPMPAGAWRFFRLRPSNFPTRRLRQAASLFNTNALFHKDAIGVLDRLMCNNPVSSWRRLLQKLLQPSVTGTKAQPTTKIGSTRIGKLLLNAICPVMLVHADHVGKPALETQITGFMQYLKFERDEVTRHFDGLALTSRHAGISQGMHELHETLCIRGRCTTCKAGKHFIYKDLKHNF
ncbi:MAG: DUF2851 family protein [Bacteroidota bacterium]